MVWVSAPNVIPSPMELAASVSSNDLRLNKSSRALSGLLMAMVGAACPDSVAKGRDTARGEERAKQEVF